MKKYSLGHKKLFYALIVISFISSAIYGYINVTLGQYTNYALAGNTESMMETIKLMIGLFVTIFLVTLIKIKIDRKYFEKTMINLKVDYMDQLLQRSPLFLRQSKAAQFVSNLTSDADRLHAQYYEAITYIIVMACQIIVSAFILTTYNLWFLPAVIILAYFFYTVARKSGGTLKKDEQRKSESLVHYTSFVDETLNGFEIIKQHKLQDLRANTFEKLADRLKKDQYQVDKRTTLVDAGNNTIQFMAIIGSAIVGVLIAIKLEMPLGSLMVIIYTFSNLLWPIQQITPTITKLSAIQTIFDDYDAVLHEELEVTPLSIDTFETLEFKDVSLGYDKPILSGVNFTINKDEKILIVGPSGQGKSTLLKSILRELDPLDGSILANGKNIGLIEMKPYFNLYSLVHQTGFIFSNTVQKNINLLGDEDVTAQLEKTTLSELSQDLMLSNNGSNISGGQRARLMLARANFFNKDVIMTDEVFASLDHSIGEALEKDMLTLPQTLINISHIVFTKNLSHYDKFLIVEDGEVLVSYDKDDVLKRMLETDIVFN